MHNYNYMHIQIIHDKTIRAASWQNHQNDCAPSEDSDQHGHPPSLIRVFAVRMKEGWVLSYPLSAQGRLWSNWADDQADLSLRWALYAWRKVGSLATHWAHREDSDQTGRMPRLIWVFAGRTATLLVLSWGGSIINSSPIKRSLQITQPLGWCNGTHQIPAVLSCEAKRVEYMGRLMTKTSKMVCAPSEDSDQPGHPPSLI